ncbi:permease [[Eubacterium] cellulosolvens]
MTEKVRIFRTVLFLLFITFVFGALIYSRITAYSFAPTMTPSDFKSLDIWHIPIAYLIDYFIHSWICLLFAFVTAGLIYEFIPKDIIMKYMSGSRIIGYVIALAIAPFLTVCSCTMVPLFAGLIYGGAGIGPAIAFLLMAPSANILAILLTGELLSWELAGVRIIASAVVALIAGIVISLSAWGKQIEREHQVVVTNKKNMILVKLPLDERLGAALKFGGYLAKKIIPFFILGLIAVSYVQAFLPEEIVIHYLTGTVGVFIASIIGGPLYTPTLVEIVIGRGLWNLGMSKGALLAWLMGQPYDVPNAFAVSRITKWKVVLTYVVIAWTGSVFFGLLYEVLSSIL